MSSAPYLKRAANGTFYVHWTENRIGKRVSTRAKDMAAAKEFFAGWLLMERKAAPVGAELTIGDLWRVYDAEHVQKKVVNVKKAEHSWRMLEPVFGDLVVPQLDQAVFDRYLKKRVSGEIGGTPVKPQTVRSELVYVIAALNFCSVAPHKLIEHTVAAEIVRGLTLPPSGQPRDRWLTLDEVRALLKTASTMRVGHRLSRGERFLWIALETAARHMAIMDLTWDRVDFETRVIHFDVPGRAKTKKRRPAVSISDALLPILKRAYAERVNDQVMENYGAIWPTIQSIAMRAGLSPKQKVETGQKPKKTGVSPHVLRHTAATQMARAGVPLFDIAGVLGNTVTMVEKVYGHHCRDRQRDAVNAISRGLLEPAE